MLIHIQRSIQPYKSNYKPNTNGNFPAKTKNSGESKICPEINEINKYRMVCNDLYIYVININKNPPEPIQINMSKIKLYPKLDWMVSMDRGGEKMNFDYSYHGFGVQNHAKREV